MNIALDFYMQETNPFSLRFSYKNADTLSCIFYAKNNALCVMFYI